MLYNDEVTCRPVREPKARAWRGFIQGERICKTNRRNRAKGADKCTDLLYSNCYIFTDNSINSFAFKTVILLFL